MPRVSVIAPVCHGMARLPERILAIRQCFRDAGHTVELLAVADPRHPEVLQDLDRSVRRMVAAEKGKTASAYRGLHEASGEYLVILDLDADHAVEDMGRIVDPLVLGVADLVVASNRRTHEETPGTLRRVRARSSVWFDLITRSLFGISDPFSGMIAVTRTSYLDREKTLTPLGSRFVLELLVGAGGSQVEVPVARQAPTRRPAFHSSDIRLMKRLADDRFGNFSRLLQFCIVGASGMVIDLSCYALFQWALSRTGLATMHPPYLGTGQPLSLAVAGAMAIALALVWNFSLNRRLTFNDARQGSIFRQFFTYVLGNALGIALSFSVRLILPSKVGFFERHKLAAAVVGIVAATAISFSMSRWIVFSHRSPTSASRRQVRRCESAIIEQS